MSNTPFTPSPEISASESRNSIAIRTARVDAATEWLLRAYYAQCPEDFAPVQPIPPSKEVQEYAAKLAATKSESDTPDALAAQRQAVDEALSEGSN